MAAFGVKKSLDWTTWGGLIGAILLISVAVGLGGQVKSFFDLTSVIIVLGGTLTVTVMASNQHDLANAGRVISSSFVTVTAEPRVFVKQLLELAVSIKKNGILSLANREREFAILPFLSRAMRMAADGVLPEDIEKLLQQEMDTFAINHAHGIGLLRRAADVAPAMGLIGTLVGLVQMLVNLSDPSAIGPAMAVALLTTFYGAILGTVILTPLAIKLEHRSEDELLQNHMIMQTALSVVRQDNPRKLEDQLNVLLDPKNRLQFFD
jgi:chemotaxis protein MotA